jgi:hypothetical protein
MSLSLFTKAVLLRYAYKADWIALNRACSLNGFCKQSTTPASMAIARSASLKYAVMKDNWDSAVAHSQVTLKVKGAHSGHANIENQAF